MQIGDKSILWEEIIGIKEYGGHFLNKLSYRFPRAEIYINNGKIITISKVNKIENERLFSSEKLNFSKFIEIVRNKSLNINPDFENHIQWRLILPIILAEIIAFIISIIMVNTLEKIILNVIFSGILSAPVGWYWEKQKRKSYYVPHNKR